MYIHCEMITIIKLINMSISSYSYSHMKKTSDNKCCPYRGQETLMECKLVQLLGIRVC